MAKIRKRGESGTAVNYISRTHSVRKLQISLAAFRRLCILKGIYPREPNNRKKAGKGSTAPRTYYYKKDIMYLMHEPIMFKLREQKIHMKKVTKAIAKKQWATVRNLNENAPEYRLDHIIKERYPSFVDAIRDLDDALSMVFLFATLPTDDKIRGSQVKECQRLSWEFLAFVTNERALRKVFLSVKGIYYQVELHGQTITWIVPYQFSQNVPVDVDFKVMGTFNEIYISLLNFVNFKLYSDNGLIYPPKRDESSDGMQSRLESFSQSLPTDQEVVVAEQIDEADEFEKDEQEENNLVSLSDIKNASKNLSKFQNLFAGCVFWLSRETPRWSLEFLIRSFGGSVNWNDDSTANLPKSKASSVKMTNEIPLKEDDDRITHHIVDRPLPLDGSKAPWMTNERREYLEPQWVYDCVNAQKLLKTANYHPGETLPPHLSPFVKYDEGIYKPEEAAIFEDEIVNEEEEDVEMPLAPAADSSDEEEQEEKVVAKGKISKKQAKEEESAAEKERALMMMTKKERRLYQQIEFGKKKKQTKVDALKRKRVQLETKN